MVETLLRANLAGHDSHGFMRLLQYVEFARDGYIDMSADVVTLRETGATALLDAGRTWGQVAAKVAMERAIEIAARQGISMVALVNCPHIGRLGEYVVMAAERDMIGTAYVNSQTGGDGNVVPWGGIEGRFTPTPLGFRRAQWAGLARAGGYHRFGHARGQGARSSFFAAPNCRRM